MSIQPKKNLNKRTELPQKTIMSCPICHQAIDSTAQKCKHCLAEKHFGPDILETALYSLIGLVLTPALSTLIMPLSLWSILIAFIGLFIGFVFSHYRFSVERWFKARKSSQTK